MINQNNSPVHVLQDLSAASLTRAIEESLAAFPLILARLPGAEIYDTPNLLWVATGVPIDSYNGVFRSILDPLRADTQIEEIRQEFRRRRLPMLWQLGPSSQPPDLRQRLLAHGFKLIRFLLTVLEEVLEHISNSIVFPGFWRKSFRQVKTPAQQDRFSYRAQVAPGAVRSEGVEDSKAVVPLLVVYPVRNVIPLSHKERRR